MKHPNNITLKNKVKRLSAELKKDIPKCRDNFYKNQFTSAEGNLKREWSVVNGILNKVAINKKPTELLVGNEVVTDKFDIANYFNHYFATIANSLRPHNQSPVCNHFTPNEPIFMESFFFVPITPMELVLTIKSLKNSNSCGTDGISNCHLKNISWLIVDILAHIFNLSINSGIFPATLQCADVIPLFKKGASNDMCNYRPISLLSSLSKVFEKVVKSRILKFLEKKSFFNKVQFGFRTGKSTEDALLNFCSDIYSNLDMKKNTAALFVDITKAFDMVDHEILLKKLECIGFRGFILEWFRTYLKNRPQRVKIDNTRSEFKFSNLGVPQGSVLGPILFLIYINSLFKLKFKGTLTAFADDVGCVYGSESRLDLICDINWDIELLRRWFADHKLIISSKTRIMFFSLSLPSIPDVNFYFHAPECQKLKLYTCSCVSSINFCNSLDCSEKCFEIEIVNQFKYLGIIIDSKMSFLYHTESLKKYLRSTLRNFYYLQKMCSRRLLRIIYNGIFQSKLQYGVTCWGGTHFNKIEPLLVLQKRIIRIICNKHCLHPSLPLFNFLKILPVRHLYCFKVLKVFFRRSGNLNFRFFDNHNLRINSMNFISIPRHRTSAMHNFYSVISCRFFNKLPLTLRTTNFSKKHEKDLKKWLLNFKPQNLECLLYT